MCCLKCSSLKSYLTILCATLIISGKYLMEGRNFSWISHRKNAVLFAASRPSLTAILECRSNAASFQGRVCVDVFSLPEPRSFWPSPRTRSARSGVQRSCNVMTFVQSCFPSGFFLNCKIFLFHCDDLFNISQPRFDGVNAK